MAVDLPLVRPPQDWQQAKEECALLSSKLNNKVNLNAEHSARLGEQLQAVADRGQPSVGRRFLENEGIGVAPKGLS